MRYALVGDSHGQVLLPGLRKHLIATGHTVVLEEANPGWSTSKYIDNGIRARLLAARPDRVIFELGGNDHQSGSTALTSMVQAARDAGAKSIVWFGPFTAVKAPYRDLHNAVADAQAKLLPSLGVRFIDTRPFSQIGHRSDGVHFASYRAILASMTPYTTSTPRALPTIPRPVWWAGAAAAVVGAVLLIAHALRPPTDTPR